MLVDRRSLQAAQHKRKVYFRQKETLWSRVRRRRAPQAHRALQKPQGATEGHRATDRPTGHQRGPQRPTEARPDPRDARQHATPKTRSQTRSTPPPPTRQTAPPTEQMFGTPTRRPAHNNPPTKPCQANPHKKNPPNPPAPNPTNLRRGSPAAAATSLTVAESQTRQSPTRHRWGLAGQGAVRNPS